MTKNLRRGGIYCRISHTDPNIPKVEVQEANARKLAAANGIEVVAVYVDDGISASKVGKARMKERPDWIRMLDDVADGRLDVLLAQAEDRFTREFGEKEVLDDLCAEHGVTYLTDQDGATDPSKASGRLTSGLKALVARYTVASGQEKHLSSNAAARLKGHRPRGGDSRFFGYAEDNHSLDPFEAELVREAYAGVIDGTLTPGKVAVRWNKAGVKTVRGGTWDNRKVAAVLERESNCGWQTYKHERVYDDKGQPVWGVWEPIVDEATYLAAVAVLRDPGRRLTKVYEDKYLCVSIARCGTCGTRLGSTSNSRATTYQCAIHRGAAQVLSVPEDAKHVSIATHILDDAVTKAVVDAVIYAPRSAVGDADAKRMGALRVRLSEIAKAQANLLELVDLPGFNAAQVAAKGKTLQDEADQIEAEIVSIRSNNAKAALLADAQDVLVGKATMAEISDARDEIRERFEQMPLPQRRALVAGMLKVAVTAGGRGAGRVKVKHLVAVGLNGDDNYADQ